MISKNKIEQLILESLKSVVDSDSSYQNLQLSAETLILGVGSAFDSIAFTAFATDFEERMENETGKEFILDIERIFALQDGQPILTVDRLAESVTKLS